MLTDLEHDVLANVRDALVNAPHGSRDRLIEQAMSLLNCSAPTVYRKLKKAGFDSARKQRCDAGDCMLSIEQLRLVSGVLLASMNQKGQRMPVGTALSMLRAGGSLTSAASDSTVSRQLYAHMLHPEQLTLPTESVMMTSKHPNHVWQVDSTTGAYYYLPGGRLRWMDEDEANKNKLHNLVKVASDLLTRYSATDHTTHAFKVRYFLGGESTQNLIEFLVWAMSRQGVSPLHGVPFMLFGDQGPANKSHLMGCFCKRLSIDLILHKPGNARATGSVEKSHDLARMHLETRYQFQDPNEVTLDKLNLDAEAWAAAYCSTRKHSRHGRTRYAAWMEIDRYPGALRVAATLEALQEAATSRPHEARVDNSRRISFKGKGYNLTLVPGVIAGMRVTVQTNVFRAPAIDVQVTDADTGEVSWQVVEPEPLNEWGYDGVRVFGEGFKGVANSVLDDNRAMLKQDAYRTGDGLPTIEQAAKARKAHAQAYAGVVDAMADINAAQVPTYLPRRGTPLELAARKVETRRLGLVEACVVLKAKLGAQYAPQIYADLAGEFGDAGVPDDQLDDICARYAQPATAVDGPLQTVQGL